MCITAGYFDVKETLKEIANYFQLFTFSKNGKVRKKYIQRKNNRHSSFSSIFLRHKKQNNSNNISYEVPRANRVIIGWILTDKVHVSPPIRIMSIFGFV
jgi:outer membrane translocation and assembly module TamA